ncbi:hypothetical protein CR513_18064, partial [Mucuna pruriens]
MAKNDEKLKQWRLRFHLSHHHDSTCSRLTTTTPNRANPKGRDEMRKFIFLVDFVILDMEEDDEVLIILGQPFMTIGKEVKFIVFNSYKISSPFVYYNCVQTLNIFDGATSGNYLNTKTSCLGTLENPKPCKEPIKKWLEKYKQHEFTTGKKVLIYNSCFLLIPNELHSRWYGPYIVTKVFPYRVVEVTKGDGATFR